MGLRSTYLEDVIHLFRGHFVDSSNSFQGCFGFLAKQNCQSERKMSRELTALFGANAEPEMCRQTVCLLVACLLDVSATC